MQPALRHSHSEHRSSQNHATSYSYTESVSDLISSNVHQSPEPHMSNPQTQIHEGPEGNSISVPGDHRQRGRVERIPTWLDEQLSSRGNFPAHYPRDAPSFDSPEIAPSPPPIPGVYCRNHVPSWAELAFSAQHRREEMNARVYKRDFVRVARSPSSVRGRGSQSSGSGNSFSSGGASRGSGRSGHHVMSSCEFCGKKDLLSTLKDHWLSCPHRGPAGSFRHGLWMRE